MAGRASRKGGAGGAGRAPRGQVIVLFALFLVVLLTGTGLAIEVGRFYSERRFLQNAADAAALAAANALIRGESDGDAIAEARDVLARNFAIPPNGIVPAPPPTTPVYAPGHAGDPLYLDDGILVSGGEVRVAIRNRIPFTFGRVVGLGDVVIGARARATMTGNLLPIAVRRFVNPPGPNSGATTPCPERQTEFMDFFATAETSCLGTETDASLRVEPRPGNAFDPANPGGDPVNHGPIVTILGQGAQPNNGADFRGFIALDIRNFQSTTSQVYYNGVTASTNTNTLKDKEAGWISMGGYPGPFFPPATTPPDPMDQVGVMSGNSTGIAIDAMTSRFVPGDEVLVAVYPGNVMQIPDFAISPPGTISLPSSGTVANAGSFKVSRNQSFSGTVTLSTVADAGDPANPMVTGTLQGGSTPITYTPNPVTPSLGSGETVSMTNVTTSGAPVGIYTLWIKGEAGSPYLTTKYEPVAVKVGSVGRDFIVTSSSGEEVAPNQGDDVTFTLSVKRVGSAFGSSVSLSLEALPSQSLPSGLGAVTFSPSSVTPTSGGATSTLTIDTGTAAPGTYRFVVRATGTNSDGQKVTHLLPISVGVATSSSGGKQEYVDIVGFAVMRITFLDGNRVDAYAITPVIPDMNDPRLRRGQTARLVPWS
ncbi:MAG TPA: pilus assembly protein TadG-related protein [Candidatus Limnocylindrales bacterium]|nr:pilus assembly protein TadG-related protein [Candidatus Limnocylindrales bacterium]